MKLVEGQLIHRRYRLDRRLAQGGMGEVWKGHDIQLNRPVAIKALRDDQGNVEAKLHRLRAEAHNSANLAHPNIAALFEYYEHDSIGFLIMEYVPSDSLADIYRDRGTLPATELLPILIQTARGLFFADAAGYAVIPHQPADAQRDPSHQEEHQAVVHCVFAVAFEREQVQAVSHFAHLPDVVDAERDETEQHVFQQSALRTQGCDRPGDIGLLRLELGLRLKSGLLRLGGIRRVRIGHGSFFPRRPSLLWANGVDLPCFPL